MQIDLKGWGVGYVSSFQQHCLLQILNSVAGMREYFAQTDERIAPPRIPIMINLTYVHNRSQSLDNAAKMMDEYSDEDEDFQIPDEEVFTYDAIYIFVAFEEEPVVEIYLSLFRVIFGEMITKIAVIVGEFLMETILNFVASAFAMISRRKGSGKGGEASP
ncbi:hypothetical protein Hanom_Chr10g00911161 [Helianthus anomalus]